MKIQSLALSVDGFDQLAGVVAAGDGFMMAGRQDFPTDIPSALAGKFDSATRVTSGSAGSNACVMYNFRRLDGDEIDQHPFIVFIADGRAVGTRSFLEHGDWPGRTTPVSVGFSAHISCSGIGYYFLAHPGSQRPSGSLSELEGSDARAFETFIDQLVKLEKRRLIHCRCGLCAAVAVNRGAAAPI